MKDRLRSRLELLRVFLTPTAVSDSLAGFIGADSLSTEPLRAPPSQAALVAGASIAAYWLGMVLNDIFDRKKDLLTAPGKPIPSGRISLREAVVTAVTVGAAALALGIAAQAPVLAVGLLAAIVAYDAGGKNVPILGNLLMGLCRSANFLLGAAAARGQTMALTTPALIAGAATLGAFIVLVTAVSRLEDEPFDAGRLLRRSAWALGIPLGLWLARWDDVFSAVNSAGLAWLLIDALRSARGVGLNRNARFHGAAIFVRKALAGVFFVDAGVVLAILPGDATAGEAGRAPVIAIFYALFGLTWLWKRQWLRRGSSGS